MRFASVVLLLVLATAPGMARQRAPIPNDEASVTHALNRLAFGPRSSDVARVRETGLGRWIEEQLYPDRMADEALVARLARFETLQLDADTIARDFFLPARRERQARQQAAGASEPRMQPSREPTARPDAPSRAGNAAQRERQVFFELAEAKVVRAAYGERQLEEVLVDFWFNHFNVFARKGQTGIYIGEYERDVIRPRVFGKFRDLLGATAKSPAMLFYLDNWQSAVPNAGTADARGTLRRPNPGQRVRGLNENYARELLELHTLGVDAGYTQDDIVNVARAFTGWTIGRPHDPGFQFAPAMHDRGAKVVLGHPITAAGGMSDGEQVLDILARHPSTARHIAFKLAQRFVSDTPPATLVERAAATFRSTEGDLREVVRAIVTSPEFFDPAVRRAKVKTPFEFVISALRAADADIRNGQAVIRALADMGMPLYLCQPPTGYDDTAESWISAGALVSRINFAVALSRDEVRGVTLGPHGARASKGADPVRFGSAEFQRQ